LNRPFWEPEKEPSPWGSAIIVVICIVIAGLIYRDCNNTALKCQVEHHGQPYTEETLFGKTSSGCSILRVEKFDEKCWERGYVYVTDCRGSISWDEHVGKTTVRRSTATEGP
jgi:hypothetical protein